MKFGGTEETIDADYKGLIELSPKEKILLYRFDGKNLIQEIPNDMHESTSLSDILSVVKDATQRKEIMLKEPPNLKKLVEFLFMVLAIVAAIAIYLSGTSASNSIKQQFQPISNISKQMQQEIQFQSNITKVMLRSCNITNAYLLSKVNTGTLTTGSGTIT